MIVVTGMHRSGTSLVAGILSRFGVDFGDPSGFYEADNWNARGYCEQRDVMDLNSVIVTGFPRTTGSFARALAAASYATMPGPERMRKRARRMERVLNRLGEKYRKCAVKDPRFCLTMGYWQEFAPIESVIVCTRHPHETVMSLRRRQSLPRWLGYRFWNYHIERLLSQIPGKRVVCVDYDRLAGAGYLPDLLRLRDHAAAGLSDEEARSVYLSSFNPGLRHFTASPEMPLPERTRSLWVRLAAESLHGAAG